METEVLDLNDLFTVGNEGNYTLLHFKKPINKVIIYDPGLYHTAICKSKLCRIDTTDGKLYYRGTPVEEKISKDFLDVAAEILFADNASRKETFKASIQTHFSLLKEQKSVMDALVPSIHPMDVLAITTTALSGVEKKYMRNSADIAEKAGFITAQIAIAVSYYYTQINRIAWSVVNPSASYSEGILSHMHGGQNPERLKKLGKILNTIMILHMEHGQNCSAVAVRNVASARGSVYTAVSCGMAAFNGTIHGGASQLVSEMYEELLTGKYHVDEYVDQKIANKQLLMGFGQRTYNRIPNCWDPRVETMYRILSSPSFDFPEVQQYKNIALRLIERTQKDPFFTSKNLTPNPDLFNCVFYKLFGVPKEMNTMMLALGRIVGWLANFIEHTEERYPLTRPADISVET